MKTVTIDWPTSHHCDDDHDQVRQQLEAGGDEGPLLVVPMKESGTGRARAKCQIFRDVDSYVGHLAMGEVEGDAEGERWVGLIRGSFHNNETEGLASLYYLKGLLDPKTKRRRLKNPAATNDHFVMIGPFTSEGVQTIENLGDGFDEVSTAFPALTALMKKDG